MPNLLPLPVTDHLCFQVPRGSPLPIVAICEDYKPALLSALAGAWVLPTVTAGVGPAVFMFDGRPAYPSAELFDVWGTRATRAGLVVLVDLFAPAVWLVARPAQAVELCARDAYLERRRRGSASRRPSYALAFQS